MNHVIHTKLGEGRRIAIPADLCQQYGLQPGGPVVLESSELGIVLRPLDKVIGEVQAYFADVAPPEVLLSQELTKDRRKHAKKDQHA